MTRPFDKPKSPMPPAPGTGSVGAFNSRQPDKAHGISKHQQYYGRILLRENLEPSAHFVQSVVETCNIHKTNGLDRRKSSWASLTSGGSSTLVMRVFKPARNQRTYWRGERTFVTLVHRFARQASRLELQPGSDLKQVESWFQGRMGEAPRPVSWSCSLTLCRS